MTTELTDELIDIMNTRLEKLGIELTIDQTEDIRDVLDYVLDRYSEES